MGAAKALVIGASGGIGAAVATALAERGASVVRLSRGSTPALDLTDDRSIADAAAALGGDVPFDLIFLATGILHGNGVKPEKTLREIDGAALDRLFRINATGPAVVMRHFLPLLARDRRAIFAVLSARVGSIGDNRLGGWVGYRASKAALNQIVRTLSIELARIMPHALLVALHPGTVETALSAPFRRGVVSDQLFTSAQAAARLLEVLDALDAADNGHCLDWAGKRIDP